MRYSRFGFPCLWLVTVGLTLSRIDSACGVGEESTNLFSVIAGPVLQCPTERSMRVTWVTERNAIGSLEYGLVDGELQTESSSRHGLLDANRRVHSIVLKDLLPGSEYRYRVISREIVHFGAYKVQFGDSVTNEFSRFNTLDGQKSEFSFLVFNDIHDQAATIPGMLKIAGPQRYDFVVLNGDIVSHTDDEKPVLSILNHAAKSFASRIPMFWVRGNHETRGSFARHLPEYIGLPKEHYYYAFDHGPVHFVVLDAGEDKIDSNREYSGLVDFASYRREQAEWLRAHVRTDAFRNAHYRVVICHMPFASKDAADPDRHSEKGVFTGMADAYEQFGEVLENAGVDLMLSGHMHVAAVIAAQPPRHSYPVVIGGGNRGNGRTITRVNVTRATLEAVMLRPDGSQAGICTVQPRPTR